MQQLDLIPAHDTRQWEPGSEWVDAPNARPWAARYSSRKRKTIDGELVYQVTFHDERRDR